MQLPCPYRLRGLRPLVAVVVSLGIVSLAMAQPFSASPLTLDAALEAAQARSAALQAQDAASRAAGEMAVSASRLPDPVLRLSVDNLPIDGPMRYSLTDDFMTMRSVSLTQTFTGSDKRQARSARYQREAEAASSTRALLKARLYIDTARAWFERYFQEQMLDVLLRQREEAGWIREAVASAYRGGRSSQAEVLTADMAIARIDDRMHEVRADLASADALLRRWVGEMANRPLGFPPVIHRSRLSELQFSSRIDVHPDIALMNAREHLALAEAEVARQDRNADWSWSVMYSERGSPFGDMVSLGVSIPLQWDQARKQDRDLSASLQRVEQVRLTREEMRREQLFKVQSLLISWRSNLTRLEDFDQALIPLAIERVQATEASFRSGKASLATVLEALRGVTDSRLERLRLEKQTATWWAELEFLILQDPVAHSQPPSPSSQSALEQLP